MAYGRFSDCPSSLVPLVYVLPGIAYSSARVRGVARRLLLCCCLLLLWLCFEGKYSAVAARGWYTPLARGSAVCEQNESHNTQTLA